MFVHPESEPCKLQYSELNEIKDYKFLCFNGKVECSFICSGRGSIEGLHVTFFDVNWNVMPFERHYPKVDAGFPKPRNYELMKILAERLSEGIPFVRIDFYEVNNNVKVGELTFFPGSGFEEFTPSEWDFRLGEKIILDELGEKI